MVKMTSHIENTFKSLSRPALVSFITAGDPDADLSMAALMALAEGGADIIELGMPFSDPMADGPTIQAASERALAAGAGMEQTLSMVRRFREVNAETPVVLMGYMNPVFSYGAERFAQEAKDAGVDGLILVDLPPEEAGEILPYAQAAGLDIIRLVTPTTDETRLETILEGASGFLYYVSITGVTGTASADTVAVKAHIAEIRKQTALPVAVGFGIKTPEDVAAMGEFADAIVVGSAIVKNMEPLRNAQDLSRAITAQVQALAGALR